MADRQADRRDDVLAAVVRDCGRALFAYGYLLTGDRAAAQDLVQDAVVKVFGRIRGGFTPNVAEAYVRRTMLTLYIDGFRRRRHARAYAHLVADPDRSPSHDVASAETLDLRAALRLLGPQERAAVVLRFYEDLTVPEIADRMGLAEGTVKRYLSNAMERLQARLGPLPGLDDDADVPVSPAAATPPRVSTRASTRTTGSRS